MLAGIVLVVLSLAATCSGFALPTPKPVTVDCQSLGNGEEFKQRLRLRNNAEDKTTIWLFKDEILNINFDLKTDAIVDVLDVRYSNDGGYDKISLSLDGDLLGSFKTETSYAWGDRWNMFMSSGPVGGRRYIKAGGHELSLNVLDSDEYGVEIDYIRFEVHGGTMANLTKKQFHCVHQPSGTRS